LPNETKGINTQQVVIILGVCVIVAASAVGLIVYLNQPDEAPAPLADEVLAAEPAADARVITPENVNQITQEVQANVERGMFMTHMNMIWNFADGESPSYDAVMGNSANNTYPLWFTVTLDETGQQVFESGLIPVGTTIAEIKLSEDLAPGSYPSTVTINLVEQDGVTPIDTNMGFSVELVIES
jgi:hypothetical protein